MGLHDRRQVFGVEPATVDERRSPTAQESEPDHVEAGQRRHAAAVDDLAAMIENGRLEPRIASDIAGRPNDRPDALFLEIERRRAAVGQNGDPRCGVSDQRLESTISDASVDPVEDAQACGRARPSSSDRGRRRTLPFRRR